MSDWVAQNDPIFAANKPLQDSKLQGLRGNDHYIFGHTLRTGVHLDSGGGGTRLAMFRSYRSFSITLSGGSGSASTGSLTFSSEATDGNPSFAAAPTMYFALEETSLTGGINWKTTGTTVTVSLQYGSLSSTNYGFDVIAFSTGSSTGKVEGIVHITAFGTVSETI